MAVKIRKAGERYPYQPRFTPEQVAGWREMLDRSDVLILDTETTGLDMTAEVIEVAVVDTTGALRFEALSMPEGPISEKATWTHRLTKERLREAGARPWPDVWAELDPVLSSASVVVGWNAEFDERLLRQTNERHDWYYPFHDSMQSFHDLMKDYEFLRPDRLLYPRALQRVMLRERGLPGRPAHRAKGDCLTVLSVMRAIVGHSNKDPRGYPSHWIAGYPDAPAFRPPHPLGY